MKKEKIIFIFFNKKDLLFKTIFYNKKFKNIAKSQSFNKKMNKIFKTIKIYFNKIQFKTIY